MTNKNKSNTNKKITIDSSIVISLLKEDVFFQEIVDLVQIIKKLGIEVIMSYITYAEIWSGVVSSKSPETDELKINKVLYELLEVNLTDFNITIARDTTVAFMSYKKMKGKRESFIPDFLIGAHAKYYTNLFLTTTPRDFLKYFPALQVLTPKEFITSISHEKYSE